VLCEVCGLNKLVDANDGERSRRCGVAVIQRAFCRIMLWVNLLLEIWQARRADGTGCSLGEWFGDV
jgi:hypothetical protein